MENIEEIEDLHHKVESLEAQLLEVKILLQRIAPVDEQRGAREMAAEVGSMGESRVGQIVEGVFDGQNMVGPDGRVYTVPANYASKSKLVEGDIMKLTIKTDGTFIYKQIGPVERIRQKATLVRDENGAYRATTQNGKVSRLLTASVTYYRGEPGDQVIILKPQDMASRWAAVENIVKAGSGADDEDLFADSDFGDGEFMEIDDAEEAGEYDDSDEEYKPLESGEDALLESGEDALLEDGDDAPLTA